MNRWLVLCALCLVACSPERLVPVAEGLSVQPRALTLPLARVGFSSRGQLVIANRGSAARDVVLSLEGPFSTDPATFALAAGASKDVEVAFWPTEPGQAQAAVTVASGDLRDDVQLQATALAAALCPATGLCHTARVDPVTGDCVDAPAPDGAACASACLQGASCRAGQCVGTSVRCDDEDACTLDGCDVLGACVHSPVHCADSTDP